MRQCRPRRSLRGVRGRWLSGVAVFTVGALFMLLGSSERNALLAPGPLTSHHAQVLSRAAVAERCATCHPGANGSAGEWLADALDGTGVHDDATGEAAATQSGLCLECHRELHAGGDPMLAHGLPAGSLDSAGRPNVVAASLGVGAPLPDPALGASHGDPLACAACHQEHHGELHDLTALTDARCQACHTERFASFAEDHPDFGLWPSTRRTRIAFDHASHSGVHFAKANKEFDCRSCHLEDASGDLTARPDYHAACAECHDAELRASFGEGLALLSLPTIDAAELQGVESWPETLQGDFDGELSALTKLLLAADPAAERAMRSLGEDFSFFDIDASDDDHLAAAATLVAALRTLLNELQEEGHGAIAYRLEQLSGRNDLDARTADLVGRLPIELIDRAQASWFGDAATPEAYDAVEDRRIGGGWSLDDDRFALRYRPIGHDDPLVRAWLDAIVSLPEERAALRDACLAEFTRPSAPGGCFECHSVERSTKGELVVNWSGRDRLAEPRGFTKFSHRPHLVQPELSDCTHCHRLDESSTGSRSYVGADPTRFTSEFVSLTKAACVECHRPHAAGDRCTQCHNYHVDAAVWRRK